MTDYNDGEFHIWGNDSAPEGVHTESRVTYVWHDDRTGNCGLSEDIPAVGIAWHNVLKFRVTKPFREPRVIWANEFPEGYCGAHPTEAQARKVAGPDAIRVAVRYVEAPE